MKNLFVIVLFLATVAGGLVVSALVTWFAWQVQITDKAFHCNDDNVSGWVVSIETHRGAGDVISPGWTWEELARVRTAYELAFFTIWLSIPTAFLMIFRRVQRKQHEQAINALPTPISGGGR